MRSRSVAGGIVVAAGSAVILAVGLLLRSHFGPSSALCNSVLGTIVKAMDPSTARHCVVATMLADLGRFCVEIGELGLFGGIGWIVARIVLSRLAGSEDV
jgi:hypothetical protein